MLENEIRHRTTTRACRGERSLNKVRGEIGVANFITTVVSRARDARRQRNRNQNDIEIDDEETARERLFSSVYLATW